jgi:tetratricopeptide (TPR) repeat protein/DNA-directed RNA polymerase subunit RPC12/RpoP
MAISFQCASCGKSFQVGQELAGKKAKCSKCGTIIVVPLATAGEAATPVSPEVVAARIPTPPAPASSSLPPVRAATGGSVPPMITPQMADDYGVAGEMRMPPLAQMLPAVRPAAGGALSADPSLAAVNNLLDRGRYVEATQALQSLAPDARNHPGYYYLGGLAYAGLGNYPHALDCLTRAIEAGVRTPNVYAAKGNAELQLGQHAAAIESLDAALDLAGTDVPDYMADLAKAYDGANMRQDAAATWNALAQISPNHPALVERARQREDRNVAKRSGDVQMAMLQMQKEQRASNTACWVCIILRILLECM